MPTFNALYGRLVRASVKGKSEVELEKLADRLYDATLAGQLDKLTQQVAGDASLLSLKTLLGGKEGE